MKLCYKNTLILEICGNDTFGDIVKNLLYGMKYFFMDFRTVMHYAKQNLREKENRMCNELTKEEKKDVEISLKEIKSGKAKKFDNVEDFLKDLKNDLGLEGIPDPKLVELIEGGVKNG